MSDTSRIEHLEAELTALYRLHDGAVKERDFLRAALSVLISDLGGEVGITQRAINEARELDEIETTSEDDAEENGLTIWLRVRLEGGAL